VVASDRAVVVGITRYPALGDLQGPENDAVAFREWLIDASGGAVPAAHIRMIRTSDFPAAPDPAKPTREAVEAAFNQIFALGNINVGRRLYIFMAGHGFAKDLPQVALLMANAARGMTGYHVVGTSYADWVRGAGLFEEVVLFMDCCRENYRLAPMQPVPYDPVTPPGGALANHFYGFATQWSKAAREKDLNGAVRGLFTSAVLDGLKGGAAPNNLGEVTGSALEQYVFNALAKSSAGDAPQEPVFDYNKMHDLVLITGAPRSMLTLSVRLADHGVAQPPALTNGVAQLQPLNVFPPDRLEWRLPPGLYALVATGRSPVTIELIGGDKHVDF
jgi:hypothetical protein